MGIAIVTILSSLFLMGAISIIVDMFLNKESTKTINLQPQINNNENQDQLAEVILEDAIDSFETMSPESFNFLDQPND